MSKVGSEFEEMDKQVGRGIWTDAYGTTSSTLCVFAVGGIAASLIFVTTCF